VDLSGGTFIPGSSGLVLGLDRLQSPLGNQSNVFARGEAFERAREALNEPKAQPSKTGVLTWFVLGRHISVEKLVGHHCGVETTPLPIAEGPLFMAFPKVVQDDRTSGGRVRTPYGCECIPLDCHHNQ
jgi:hypothetical protein